MLVDHAYLRQRSYALRLLLTPLVFCRHYKAFRVFGSKRWGACRAAALFTGVLLSWPCDR